MSKSILSLGLLLLLRLHLQAAAGDSLGSTLAVDGSTAPPTYTFGWWGTSGYHYLVERSDDLITWTFLPNFNPAGADAPLSVDFTSTSPRVFVRAIQFDPNDVAGLSDGDTDGLPDKWEMYQFGNLSRDGSGDYDDDGLTDVEEFQLGLNPKTNEVGPKTSVFAYDAIGRLTTVTGNNNSVTFTLDPEGNITHAQ